MKLIFASKIRDQEESDSFIGGLPKLPSIMNLPLCKLCGAKETFFYQIAFPPKHAWNGRSLAVFFCTSCVEREYLIPEMLNIQLKGAVIPDDFLRHYQRNFSFLVFNSSDAAACSEYLPKVEYRSISFIKKKGYEPIGHLFSPNWVLEDESPAIYEGAAMGFLHDLNPNIQFTILKGAPPQIELGLTGEPQDSPLPYYQLFIGNAIYFFGDLEAKKYIYCITQV